VSAREPGAAQVGGALLRSGDRIVGRPFATRSPVLGARGMVCASQPLAARIGADVLADGGSAVDAAIATNAMLGLTEPTGCGLGGDLFALLWDPEAGALVGLNGSGRSAASLGLPELSERLKRAGERSIPLRSALAVSVPGCVDGWFSMHERYGRLPMARLLEPAIEHARRGVPITQIIAADWRGAEQLHADAPGFAEIFLPDGRAPVEGQLHRNPDLARSYELLVAEGRDGFYTGAPAADIAAVVQGHGGVLGVDDLAAHRSQWVQPLGVSYRGHEVWELPPNGQGLAALQMLKLIEPWSLGESDALSWHRMIEAKKLAYEDRARCYCDPDFADLPQDQLVSEDYAAARRRLIDDERASQSLPPGDWNLRRGDTVYLTCADERGQVVSWIQSNYAGFGTGLVPSGWGFSLQNRGCLFALDPDHANCFAAGKRPFHTIIPAMMTRAGEPVLSFGVMGGDMQPQGHVQIVTHLLDHGMNVQEAGDAPRWRHEGSSDPTGEVMHDGGVVHLETGVPADIVAGLEQRGHRVQVGSGGFGGYQAIAITDHSGPNRIYRGASECRKDGQAIGL
jgi:gamma-glutamyltranspeptidase/glutathione hydrolase